MQNSDWLQPWKEEEVYKTSGSCFGRIDSAVVTKSNGEIVIIVRGWLLSEDSVMASLQIYFQGKAFDAIPRIPRDDVQAAFPSVAHADQAGFTVVLKPSFLLSDDMNVSFTGMTWRRVQVSGKFCPLQPTYNNQEVAIFALLASENSRTKKDILILSVPLVTSSLHHGYSLLMQQIQNLGFSWELGEDIDPRTFNGDYSSILIFGNAALREFLCHSQHFIIEKSNSQIIAVVEELAVHEHDIPYALLSLSDLEGSNSRLREVLSRRH